jgi:hypothetical protein
MEKRAAFATGDRDETGRDLTFAGEKVKSL